MLHLIVHLYILFDEKAIQILAHFEHVCYRVIRNHYICCMLDLNQMYDL